MLRHVRTFYNEKERIWSGYNNIPSFFNPNISIGHAVLDILMQNPSKIAQISATTHLKITNKEMATMSIRVAQNLQSIGLKQEDVIGIMASNSDYLTPVVFGAFLCGTPISTLDPSFKKDAIIQMYRITKPKIIFCDSECYYEVENAVKEFNFPCAIYTLKGSINGVKTAQEILKETGNEEYFIPSELIKGGDQTAAILCSSGTTGYPKGVCMSHRSLLKNAINGNHDDVYLCFSSLYWLTGLLVMLFTTLTGASRIIMDEAFSVQWFFDIVEKYKVTQILTPPSQMALILQSPEIETRDLSSLKFFMCGGSAVHPSLSSKMKTYLKNGILCVGYGMSEICGPCSTENEKLCKLGSCGQLRENFEIKIINENGKSMGTNETGEILIRIMIHWAGYYNDPESTKKTIDSDGWVHSGDLGYFDNDGYLFVIDRIKDILKFKNFHFFPTEIEATILEIPDVLKVCVFGLPDLVYTDLPAAVIVKRPDSKLSEQDVYNFVATKLDDYKNLRGGVYFMDELPETASGKTPRNIVKEILMKKKGLKNGNN